jgi:hypothetical protein
MCSGGLLRGSVSDSELQLARRTAALGTLAMTGVVQAGRVQSDIRRGGGRFMERTQKAHLVGFEQTGGPAKVDKYGCQVELFINDHNHDPRFL